MFKPATGMHYHRFLRNLHDTTLLDWYMEIGCRDGSSFAPVRSKTIAVDPFFRVERNAIGAKPALHIFQQTSDDFFASGFLDALGIRLSLSFLDGMHLFEYLLRDVIQTERRSRPDGVIMMHDCCPFDHPMTTRDLNNIPEAAWTGDVWKLLPILKQYRPDLKIDVLDCKPTGLVMLSNLDPGNTALSDAYDKILADWVTVTLEDYGTARFFESFDYVSARGQTHLGHPLLSRVKLDDSAAFNPVMLSS
ncbi:hypothetical protein [Nioella aestuarii]|uniref:hypothetical protein n=1 Tax=Nioella aestuarii TaxID=1662864 RepID=UPI003D7FA36B